MPRRIKVQKSASLMSTGRTYLNITDEGTDTWLRQLESAPGFAHDSHKPAEPPTDGASEAPSADNRETVAM